jgi:hypothetical protein
VVHYDYKQKPNVAWMGSRSSRMQIAQRSSTDSTLVAACATSREEGTQRTIRVIQSYTELIGAAGTAGAAAKSSSKICQQTALSHQQQQQQQ